jgi:8-oxo-dGTP diphosphatase
MSSDIEFEKVEVVAGCVLKKDNKYLLVQESRAKIYGLWNIPAGHVDKGESIEQAAIREAKEESGFDVKLGNKLGIYHESIDVPIKHVYEAQIIGGELNIPTEEILDAKWLTYDDIKSLDNSSKLRGGWIMDTISKLEAK